MIVIIVIIVVFFICRFFLFLILNKVICPFLVKHFGMLIWLLTDEGMLDALLNAEVDI
jgi:hypothetical protein